MYLPAHPLTSFNLSWGAMPGRVQSMKQSPSHPFSLSPVADSLRQPFPEIRLLPDGAFAARDGRPGTLTGGILNAWTLSQASAARLIAQWRRRETPLVIDYEHQSLNARHNGRPAPAAGWIESLRHAPGEGLFAAVRWTEGAKAFIGQDEYRFISPVFSFNPQTGEVLELKGAALTNVPALDGLGAIAATEAFPGLPGSPEPQQEADMTALNRLKRLLGLPEDAEDGAVQSELDRLESLLAPDEDPLLGAARPTLFDYVQACHPDAALNTLERVNASLREQLSVALTSAQGDRVSRLVEEAVAEGRLSRGLVGWAATLGRQNPEALESYLAAVSPLAALTSFQTGGGRASLASPAASPLSDEERFVCAQLGLSEADFAAVRG